MVKHGQLTRLYRNFRASGYAERLEVTYASGVNHPIATGPALSLCWGASGSNFGDALSPLIVHLLSGRRLQGKNNDASIAAPRLLALGSILERAVDHDVVWGSGARGESLTCSTLDVHAVRGPLTRAWLQEKGIKCPEVYGDPAILMPWLYRPEVNKDFDIGVIRHYTDRSSTMSTDLSVNVIDVTDEPLKVINEICRCRTVFSSSLHGLVIAEAYGIPSCWLRPADELWVYPEPRMKYEDYYLGSGRDPNPFEFDTMLDLAKASEFAAKTEKPDFQLQKLLGSFPCLRAGIRTLDDLERFRISAVDVNVSMTGFIGYVLTRIKKKLKQ
ncbi:MAG: polysaccharide pyruvyl transferase family protein [Mariprofundaceae bacterium]|nr:polysaccharide pyruvyl transferase family protein [Mariprofundaceae bacterium]